MASERDFEVQSDPRDTERLKQLRAHVQRKLNSKKKYGTCASYAFTLVLSDPRIGGSI